MKSKKGISLIALVITLIIMMILASVALYTSADATNNAKLTSFAEDLINMEDLVSEYYLTNNELPMVSGVSYVKADVLDLCTNGVETLSEEITTNGDDSAVFVKLDLAKLPIDSSSRGMGEKGTTDIYLISSQNFNVYYLQGEEIAKEYYFSLTKKLTGRTEINKSETTDTSKLTISKTSGIKLTKSENEWTNELSVDVVTTLATNETIEYLLAGTSIGTSTNGTFTINVSSILNANETLKNTFYTNNQNKVLVVNKYDTTTGSNVLVATASINVSNLDMLSSTATPIMTIKKYTEFTLINVSGYSDLGGSGIKEARVLYTKKLDADSNEIAYYSDLPATITAEYVRNTGVSMDSQLLRLPADVTEYVVVFIDNASNVSNISTHKITY